MSAPLNRLLSLPTFSNVYGWINNSSVVSQYVGAKAIENPIVAWASMNNFGTSVQTGEDNVSSPFTTYSGSQIRQIEDLSWNRLHTPRWNDYLLKLKMFESKYDISSEDFYEKYKKNKLGDTQIRESDMQEWLRLYRLYNF